MGGFQLLVAFVADGPRADHERTPPARAHLLRHGGLIIFGEVPGLARVRKRAGPHTVALFEAAEPLRRVGDEARLTHLPIAHHVETCRHLLLYAVLDRPVGRLMAPEAGVERLDALA